MNAGEEARMAAKPIILVDDGGVMSDNRLRGSQWQRLVGEFFMPRLGGDAAAWSEANRVYTAHLFEPTNWRARVQATPNYPDFERVYWLDWLGGMCQFVGVKTPPEEESIELARQAEAYITPRVRAAVPGAVEAILKLHTQGYELHTASGESSIHLQNYLQGMGVRESFGHLYGSDLVGMLKEWPAYYERLFTDSGIAPGDALVIDDSPRNLAWARDLGAMTVLVNSQHEALDGMLCIRRLAELPELVQHLA
jgi:HAD superfamily hydrolase (TIGR01509 family)